MKKILSILFLFALLVSSCSEEELVKGHSSASGSLKFTASFEGSESRTYVEKGNLLRWTAGDEISLFVGNTLNRQYQFDGETGDNSGTFSVVDSPFGTGQDLNSHYAVYPYAKSIKITDDTDEVIQITATLPAEQSYAENSFGPGANTMVAVTKDVDDTYLKFKNVCGYLKLQLYGDDVTVKTITLKGNANEKIAGNAVITPTHDGDPNVSMADDSTESITLNCGENGVKIGNTAEEATIFLMVVPPTAFESGLTVTIIDVNGCTFTQSTSKKVVVERNVINPMAAFDVRIEIIPNNQIWYTSNDGKIVTPNKTDVFGASIVSNVYEDGKGIITFDGDVISIGEYAFRDCSSLTDITIPGSVKSIDSQAFAYCSALIGITIPDSVTSINNTAFDCCVSLASIVVDSNNPVYDSRENCNAIIETDTNTLIGGCKNTIIPNGISSIGGYAFFGRFSLVSITFPNSVTSIGGHAFRNCSSLTSITIPKSVTSINEGAFANCSSLSSIVVEEGNTVYDSRESCNAIIETVTNTLISGCKNTVIPNSVITIGSDAFVCQSLTSITVPNSITSINSYGFYFCSSLAAITIPSSVTSIGDYAFRYCSSLIKVNVKATTPPALGREAFANCSSDLKIYVPAGSLEAYKAANYWKELDINEGTIPSNQIWYTSSDGNIVTPNNADVFGANIVSNIYADGKGIITFDGDVTMIEYRAFWACSSLTSITIPDSVTKIADDAFPWCSALSSIVVEEGNSVYDSRENCNAIIETGTNTLIAGCKNTVIPNGVTKIGDTAFCGCSSLENITIPNSVTEIGDAVFSWCSSLSSIVVEEGNAAYDSRDNSNAIIETGTNTLIAGCKNTVIPNGVTKIGDSAFCGCFYLTSISIPSTVTNIGVFAFDHCKSLTSISIPYNVTSIGGYAFGNCTTLSEVDVKATTPPTMDSDVFTSCSNDLKIYVPAGSIDAYKAADEWTNLNLLAGNW